MKTVFFGSLLSLVLLVDGRSWQPRSPLHASAMMKDLVNSRALPTISSSPQGGTSGSSSVTPKISDDVARGGHASVKTSREEEQIVEPTHNVATTAVVNDTNPIRQEAVEVEDVKAINVDVDVPVPVPVEKLTNSQQKKKMKTAAKIAKKLKNRNHINIRRKIMHANFGLFFSMLNWVVPRSKFLPGMAMLTGGALIVELLRYKPGFEWMNDLAYKLVGSGIRKHEMEGKFTGILYFWSGVTLSAALFSKPCATLGIMQLAIADPSASYFGTKTKHVYWSRIERGFGGIGRNKGILGFLGGALCCVPFNYRLLSIAKFGTHATPTRATLALASFGLGLAGAFADLAVPTPVVTLPKKILGRRVPPFHLDDNFVVPIFSAFACEQMFKALGWPLELELARFMWF